MNPRKARETIAFPCSFLLANRTTKGGRSILGPKRLGFLRMDVDHLGEIFRSGLPISTLAAGQVTYLTA